MRKLFPLLIAVGLSGTVAAQPVAPAANEDSRVRVIDYDPGQAMELRAAADYQLTLEFGRDEQVLNVAVGNSTAWQVSVNSHRNLVFLKPMQDAPNTNLTVFTNSRTYLFDLRAVPALTPDMPFTVRLQVPAPNPAIDEKGFIDVSAAERRISRYRITGDPWLRPDSVTHDSQFTYIAWPKDRDLPATYEIGPDGKDMLVNGIMRDDVLVIDRVIDKLRFRRDSKVAEADMVHDRRNP
jgi:type IV secretion system protein VirB9